MKAGLVSVIINCLNAERFLSDAISSVLGQTYPEFEIIIWDNNSTDDTRFVANQFTDPRIRYFKSNLTTSLGRARNLALKEAEGEFIAYLDSDDMWLPQKLERSIELFDDEEVGMVITNTYFLKENYFKRILYKKNKPPVGYCFREMLQNYCISLETVLVKRSFVSKLLFAFDERLELTEEYDFFARLLYFCKLAYLDEPLSIWRIHDSNATLIYRDFFWKERLICLENLMRQIPDFELSHADLRRRLVEQIDIEKGVALWSRGENSEARKLFLKHLFKIKPLVFFLFSFANRSFFEMFKRLIRRDQFL